MGVSGVPLNFTKGEISAALKKAGGRMNHAAKLLDIHPATLYRHVNADADLTQLLADLRYSFDELILDKAEDKLVFALEQFEDLGNGLKASMFVLNTKGAKRGYVPAEVAAAKEEANRQQNLGLTLQDLQDFAEWRAARRACRNESQASSAPLVEAASKSESADLEHPS